MGNNSNVRSSTHTSGKDCRSIGAWTCVHPSRGSGRGGVWREEAGRVGGFHIHFVHKRRSPRRRPRQVRGLRGARGHDATEPPCISRARHGRLARVFPFLLRARRTATVAGGVVVSEHFSWQSAVTKSYLEPSTKLVLLVIGTHMNQHGQGAFPSYEMIASGTSLNRATVIRHVEMAIAAGWLSKGHVKHAAGMMVPAFPEGQEGGA
ncbi:helix-turn-helix domain-containing protein [Xanthomonas oryzae pv. oryzae]|nr:helix-turn-helix domain-containing protein [Xanthomonas oryzae pv. oryzae]QBN29823.1 helix-turn-helix domain-containing protein [Xanthomonas oryzae pv. oryzae]QBN62568.1 helix-turn-helix domain-containing protein [Xanthomonas oryzae pv. oryzae]QBN66212.1 helix-turn-helix domain-containing protein [Xanthomonas oryzae pv. oryzae]